MSKEPDLAERIECLACRAVSADRIRATLAASPELAQVREACEKQRAWLIALAGQSERAMKRDARFESLVDAHRADAKNFRATAKHMEAALATLNALTGKAP